jgi:hypothetical protein
MVRSRHRPDGQADDGQDRDELAHWCALQPTKQTVGGQTCVRFDGTGDYLSLDGDALQRSRNAPAMTTSSRSTGGGCSRRRGPSRKGAVRGAGAAKFCPA